MPHRPAAAELDAADPLAAFRDRFVFPDPSLVYLDGNSLGRLPHAAVQRSRELVEVEWGDRLIRSWNESWWEAPQRIGNLIGDLIGAQSGEVIIADSTSVNLFKLAVAALRLHPERRRIVTDDLNFPSDLYVLRAAAAAAGGHQVDVIPSDDGIHGPVAALEAALDGDVALLTLSHVAFKSGYRYDMAALNASAHAVGAVTLWDLSHSVGAIPVDLGDAGTDLAIGCTYKYLNGGPGAPAFSYVRSDLHDRLANPIAGWWGHRSPFEFDAEFAPAIGMRRFLTGTAPMISLALIEPGVRLVLEAGIAELTAKSQKLSEYLIERWHAELSPLGFTLNSPVDAARRGSHVSLGHPDGLGIDLALINEFGVLPDFRPPDNLRFGIAPLYTSFRDIDHTVQSLGEIVTGGLHQRYAGHQPDVT